MTKFTGVRIPFPFPLAELNCVDAFALVTCLLRRGSAIPRVSERHVTVQLQVFCVGQVRRHTYAPHAQPRLRAAGPRSGPTAAVCVPVPTKNPKKPFRSNPSVQFVSDPVSDAQALHVCFMLNNFVPDIYNSIYRVRISVCEHCPGKRRRLLCRTGFHFKKSNRKVRGLAVRHEYKVHDSIGLPNEFHCCLPLSPRGVLSVRLLKAEALLQTVDIDLKALRAFIGKHVARYECERSRLQASNWLMIPPRKRLVLEERIRRLCVDCGRFQGAKMLEVARLAGFRRLMRWAQQRLMSVCEKLGCQVEN